MCDIPVQSAVTSRGQILIPATIRKQLNLHPGDTLMWINDGQNLRLVPHGGQPTKSPLRPSSLSPHAQLSR